MSQKEALEIALAALKDKADTLKHGASFCTLMGDDAPDMAKKDVRRLERLREAQVTLQRLKASID